MDMRANFLASFCRAKNSDNWNLGLLAELRGVDIIPQNRIELARCSLVVVYAVQADAEKFHGERVFQSGGRIESSTVE